MTTSTGSRSAGGHLEVPGPWVLASLTDGHFLAVLGAGDEPLSRADIAERSGLSKPAISAAAVRLLDRGVVVETGIREGRRGGVARLLQLNANHGHSIAIAVQTDSVAVRTRDLTGALVGDWRRSVPAHASTGEVVAITNELIDSATPKSRVLAAAVSMAHAVDSSTGRPADLLRSVAPTLVFDARADLHLNDALRLEVDNDVNWATRAEVVQGALDGCRDFIYVYCGAGLGAGLYLDGRLYRGRRGLAGEIGYLREGPTSAQDLTERLAALGLGSAERYGLDLGGAVSLFDSRSVSKPAIQIAEAVAIGVANMAVTLNPEAVALGGPLSTYPAFFDHVARRVAELTIDPPAVVRSRSTPLDGASLAAHALALEVSGVPTSEAGRP